MYWEMAEFVYLTVAGLMMFVLGIVTGWKLKGYHRRHVNRRKEDTN